jgi:cysteine-rich repeat protein
MNSSQSKRKFKKCLWPALFFAIVCLLVWTPAKQARADCGTEACPICGDNLKAPTEVCDVVDGVSIGCAVNQHCTGPNDQNPCTCVANPKCGDNTINSQTCTQGQTPGDGCQEECDGVNTASHDACVGIVGADLGCNAKCECEHALCGNGKVAGEENCDDGSECDSGADCTAGFLACEDSGACVFESDITSSTECKNCLKSKCADNSICKPRDTLKNGVVCLANCQPGFCGDGIINPDANPPEQCDDGPKNGTEGDPCNADCTVCPSQCGDGILNTDLGEECDEGALNNINGDCLPDCTKAKCGDSIQRTIVEECSTDADCANNDVFKTCIGGGCGGPAEQCDDGNTNNNDECLTNCKLNVCGDGIVFNEHENGTLMASPTELCDDGKTCVDSTPCTNNPSACAGLPDTSCMQRNNDGCSNNCQTCPSPSTCGDGHRGPNEPCDGADTSGCGPVPQGDDHWSCVGCVCVPVGPGPQCTKDSDCHTDNACDEAQCDNGVCVVELGEGNECDSDSDCDEGCANDCTCKHECEAEGGKGHACTDAEELGHKVTICHHANDNKTITICVDEHAEQKHIDKHGDTVGACVNECVDQSSQTIVGQGQPDPSAGGGCSLVKGHQSTSLSLIGLAAFAAIAMSLYRVRRSRN